MTIQSIDPTSGEVMASYKAMLPEAVKNTVDRVHEAFLAWRQTTFAERCSLMHKAAHVLRTNAADYARTMAREMGKPMRDGIAEAQKCALCCDFYAEHAGHFLAREPVATEARKSFVTFQPLGVVLAIMPWNFPFWQVFRFAAPGLMAGNAAVLKHASNVSGCALAIEGIFLEAGFPRDLFRTLLIESAEVKAVIEHPLVRAVTLTGSGPAGRKVASQAGAALKRTVLELGGSDPYLVLEDADLDLAARISAKGRLVNSGQSCIAAKRFIVVEKIRRDFEQRLMKQMGAVRMGDPLEDGTEIGPLARHDLRDNLHRQVQDSIAQGAVCLLGGAIPPGPGAYYPPTILTGVRKGMPACDEELFGPVAAIVPVPDEARAIAAANDSVFGLGGGVFTRDLVGGEHIAEELIESGMVFVNEAVHSDPRLPFGGIRQSGYGRELSRYGIKEFVNIKTVFIA